MNCHMIVYGNICPNCKSTTFSDDYTGVLNVVDAGKSEIAQKVGITKPGKYALKVR